ncbi:MAG: helix-turn-helix domain-containing protein [Gammaproteobacteria bacterium]|nr:helix-turn-helix domain-containing protein [Gammaproteobacteria bacterium]
MQLTGPTSDETVLAELGRRLARYRLDRNLSQAELARSAGVSKRTVERLESGASSQLGNFLRVCRALDLLPRLDALLPPPLPSPMEQLRLGGRQRRRASASRGADAAQESDPGSWRWDEGG